MGIKLSLDDGALLSRDVGAVVGEYTRLFLDVLNGEPSAIYRSELVAGFKQQPGQRRTINCIDALLFNGREVQRDAPIISMSHDTQAQCAIGVADPSLAR